MSGIAVSDCSSKILREAGAIVCHNELIGYFKAGMKFAINNELLIFIPLMKILKENNLQIVKYGLIQALQMIVL